MYDTTVEAFNTQGTAVDDLKNDNRESVIGLSDEDAHLFVEDNEQLDGFVGQKFECNDTNLPKEDSSSKLFSVENENLSSLSCSTAKVKTVTTSAVSIPGPGNNRRLSAISLEESSKISTTPEGEKYFMKREESFVTKVSKGELSSLAVEISDFCSLQNSASDHSLSVKPMKFSPEKEIVVDDLGSQSSLTVKPLEKSKTSVQGSSYEQIYDSVEMEEAGEQE